jgi:hypothetical protein
MSPEVLGAGGDAMRIRLAIPNELDDHERRDALNAALECTTRVDEALIRKGKVPTAAEAIRQGVRWQPEPPGDEHFDIGTTVMRRRWGDCDDLAPLHAASLRASGRDPGARAVVSRSGPNRWHAWVLRSDGSKEDPSIAAGMRASVSGLVGGAAPIINPMSAEGRMCLAICPSRDRRHPLVWFARCDAPDRLEPWNWSLTAAHPDPRKALLEAIHATRHVAGEQIDPEDDARLGALSALVLGHDPSDIADALHQLIHPEEDEDGLDLDGVGGDDDMDVDGIVDDAVQSASFLGSVCGGPASVGSWWRSALRTLAPAIHNVPGLAPAIDVARATFGGGFHPGRGLAHLAQQGLANAIPSGMMPGMPGMPSMIPGGGAGTPQGMQNVQMAHNFLAENPQLAHILGPILQMGLPLAGTAFLGPLGAFGGSMLSNMIVPQQGGMPGGMPGGGMMQMMPGMMPATAPAPFPGFAPTTFGLDPGTLLQSVMGGPLCMRF